MIHTRLASEEGRLTMRHGISIIEMIKLTLVATIVLLLIQPLPIRAQYVSESEFRRAFQKAFSEPEQAQAIIRKVWGGDLPDAYVEILANDMAAVMLHSQLPAYFTRTLNSQINSSISTDQATIILGNELDLIRKKGIRRLPSTQQLAYFIFGLEFLKMLPDKGCEAVATNKITTAHLGILEREYARSLPIPEFRRFSSIARDASIAELSARQPLQSATPDELSRAWSALEQETARITLENTRQNDTAQTTKKTSDCQAMKLTLQALIELPNPYQNWLMLELLQHKSSM